MADSVEKVASLKPLMCARSFVGAAMIGRGSHLTTSTGGSLCLLKFGRQNQVDLVVGQTLVGRVDMVCHRAGKTGVHAEFEKCRIRQCSNVTRADRRSPKGKASAVRWVDGNVEGGAGMVRFP